MKQLVLTIILSFLTFINAQEQDWRNFFLTNPNEVGITQGEYREFVKYIEDSIRQILLKQRSNFLSKRPDFFTNPKYKNHYIPNVEELFYSGSEKFYGKNEINVHNIRYTIDNKSISVYPDSLFGYKQRILDNNHTRLDYKLEPTKSNSHFMLSMLNDSAFFSLKYFSEQEIKMLNEYIKNSWKITFEEYNEFLIYVRDSIAHKISGSSHLNRPNDKYSGINWKKKINWKELRSGEEMQLYKTKYSIRMPHYFYNFAFEFIDFPKIDTVKNIPRKDAIVGWTTNVFPLEKDSAKIFNPKYKDSLVTDLSESSLLAYFSYKSRNIDFNKSKKYIIDLILPTYEEWKANNKGQKLKLKASNYYSICPKSIYLFWDPEFDDLPMNNITEDQIKAYQHWVVYVKEQHFDPIWNLFLLNLKARNKENLVSSSSDSITCSICTKDNSETFKSDYLFNNYLDKIYNQKILEKAQYGIFKDDNIFRVTYQFNDERKSSIVYMFDKIDGEFKFTGVITIP